MLPLGMRRSRHRCRKEVHVVRTQQVKKDSEEPPKWARDWMSKMERQLTDRHQRSVYVPRNAQQFNSGDGRSGRQLSIVCFSCGQQGHITRECPALLNAQSMMQSTPAEQNSESSPTRVEEQVSSNVTASTQSGNSE